MALSLNDGKPKIYRFKIINPELYQEMMLFAEKNVFLNKEDLKDTFDKWIELPNISTMIRGEEEMLKINEYDLDKTTMVKKIFKSIKYYHIKNMTTQKNNAKQDSTNSKQKKNEIAFSKEMLGVVKECLSRDTRLKPSQYYDNFVLQYKNEIKKEQERFNYSTDNKEQMKLFETKLKKMIKNQYYMTFQKASNS